MLPADTLVVVGGSLFDGRSDSVGANPGIVVANGRFEAFGADAVEAAVGAGAERVELADGEVVTPGFFYLHAHNAVDLRGEGRVDEIEVYPILFLANGVTSTFPDGEVQLEKMRSLRLAIEGGERIGPRL